MDTVLFIAQYVAAWSVGFCGAYLLTVFRRAVDQIT